MMSGHNQIAHYNEQNDEPLSNEEDSDQIAHNTEQNDERLNNEDIHDSILSGNITSGENVTSYEIKLFKGNCVSAKLARWMARRPALFLIVSLLVCIGISAFAIVVGKFTIEVNNAGWYSRGTLISNREQQSELVRIFRRALFNDVDGSVWTDLTTKVQSVQVDDNSSSDNRRLAVKHSKETNRERNLIESSVGTNLLDCDVSWYNPKTLLKGDKLTSVWKVQLRKGVTNSSALDPEVLREICHAEEKTLIELSSRGLCYGCPNGACLPPHSLVLILRAYLLPDSLTMNCDQLVEAYTPDIRFALTKKLSVCAADEAKRLDSYTTAAGLTNSSCSLIGFGSNLVDGEFLDNKNIIRYTSSIFPSNQTRIRSLFKIVDLFDRGDSNLVVGAYETSSGSFADRAVLKFLKGDMILAVMSGVITLIAIVIHTQSLWLSFIGILNVVLSFPLSYCIYHFPIDMEFFPFLNFIGIFVVFALGADDIFVAVDKWKNYRLAFPNDSTEEIASGALPDAAVAMLLTTSTTAVAFFATIMCPVAPIGCFSLFCGLLVTFAYILNILLVFPALCLYDRWILSGRASCLVAFSMRVRRATDKKLTDDCRASRISLIHRILSGYYAVIHYLRWILLALCAGSFALIIIFALRLKLPDTQEVRLLSNKIQYEKNFLWGQNLLSTILSGSSGSTVSVIWGLLPADTGNHFNPSESTTLVLDPDFNPREIQNQVYLLDFCDRFFSENFTDPVSSNYKCPLNLFDTWLKNQSNDTNATLTYQTSCGGASSVPVATQFFDSCLIGWSKMTNNLDVLQDRGVVKIIIVRGKTIARYTSPHSVLNTEWQKFEHWLNKERNSGPTGVNNMFHTNGHFWWYDTNKSMVKTAISSALVAVGFAMFVVICSSQSIVLTIFSAIAVAYVLGATAASLVGMGWRLGFLESICFSILIGVSVDFTLHFAHAYSLLPGDQPREERTKFCVTHMGPSVLASAFTTIAASCVMFFCHINFFTKFALILFFSMVHSLIASFIIFLLLCDVLGPKTTMKCFQSIRKVLNHKVTD